MLFNTFGAHMFLIPKLKKDIVRKKNHKCTCTNLKRTNQAIYKIDNQFSQNLMANVAKAKFFK